MRAGRKRERCRLVAAHTHTDGHCGGTHHDSVLCNEALVGFRGCWAHIVASCELHIAASQLGGLGDGILEGSKQGSVHLLLPVWYLVQQQQNGCVSVSCVLFVVGVDSDVPFGRIAFYNEQVCKIRLH